MNIKVIVNPQALNGRDKYLQALLQEQFGRYVVRIEKTTCPRHATDIARRAVKENVDTVVAVGGDGTVNEVVNGVVGTDVGLGIVPAGTANDLASLHKIPTDVEAACEVIRERHLQKVDVINVNGWYYVTAGGFGLPCEVASIANTIKSSGTVGKLLGRVLGSHVYILAVLCALINRKRRNNLLNIRWDGGSLNVDPLWLMVDNQPFLGKTFLLSPGAANDDGVFDICLIEGSKSRLQILRLLVETLAGTHIYGASAKTWCTGELIVNAKKPLPFFGDGEIVKESADFRIAIVPGALNVVVPKHAP
jgi:YegS/Rv2252/BmrU family lipid kinase